MANELTIHEGRLLTKEEKIEHILGEMSGGRSLNSILTEDEQMPAWSAFWKWYSNDEVLEKKLARAREVGIEALMEKAQSVAETPLEGIEAMEEIGPDGVKRRVTRKEMLGHRRLLIETYVKRAQMMKPKTYGPKLDVTSDGEKLSNVADAIAAGNARLERRQREAKG